MPEALKLAIVTDIHHGPTRYTKRGDRALPLLREFRTKVECGGIDLVVELGDRITNVDRDTDRQLMHEVAAQFEGLSTPHVHLLGNHDLHYLTAEENEDILGCPMRSHSMDIKGRHLVFWQHDLSGRFSEKPLPSPDELSWLRADLEGTVLPTVIFTHVPLNGAAMAGNYYFQNNTDSATLRHAADARAIFEAAGNVVLCVAGHVHWNDVGTIDGIRYLTQQSLTESYTTRDEASGCWADIVLDESLRWRVHGGDPVAFEAPLRGHNSHWTEPLPPFEVLRGRRAIASFDAPVRGVILDMDGVLYRGDTPIDGSAEAVRALQDAGLRVVCLTNNARHSPQEYAGKLCGFGISIPAADIVTSGDAVARYLAGKETAPKVHIVGSAALRQTVLAAGAVESDAPDYVVAGIDLELTLADMIPAVRYLARGAELVASNGDAVIPTPQGPEPEAGPVIAFLEAASGRKAIVPGKPAPAIFELALERLGVSREEAVMIGDTPETDIAGARAAGLRSIMVETGNAAASDPEEREATVRVADLRAAVELLTQDCRLDGYPGKEANIAEEARP
jgi:Icc protein